MDKIPKRFDFYINKITQKVTYLDKYGGSVIVTGIILFSFFLIFSYFYVMNKLKPIKTDWVNQRCNPAVMPFAGLINAPPNSSKIESLADLLKSLNILFRYLLSILTLGFGILIFFKSLTEI